jgi:hypothetical protein
VIDNKYFEARVVRLPSNRRISSFVRFGLLSDRPLRRMRL